MSTGRQALTVKRANAFPEFIYIIITLMMILYYHYCCLS